MAQVSRGTEHCLKTSVMLSASHVTTYSPNRLRRLTRRLMHAGPAVELPEGRLILHDIHSNWIPAGRIITEHSHSFYEAHIVLDGSPELILPRALPANTGVAFLFPPQAPHAWQTYMKPMSSFVIWFNIDFTPQRHQPVWWAPLPLLLWNISLLLAEVQEAQYGWRERADAFLTATLSRILALTREPSTPARESEADSLLESIVSQFLWDNLQRPQTIAEVADHVGMSERNLYRRFSQITGQTINQRLQRFRIQRAQTLLEESDAPISEIGHLVGIPDAPYFCRSFKKQTGVSPHQYRISMRG